VIKKCGYCGQYPPLSNNSYSEKFNKRCFAEIVSCFLKKLEERKQAEQVRKQVSDTITLSRAGKGVDRENEFVIENTRVEWLILIF
jgi:hypothetical protein